MLANDYLNKSYWALSTGEVLDLFETTMNGLRSEEARKRQAVFGKNLLKQKPHLTKFKIFLSQFSSPLIFLLIIAGVVAAIVGDFKSAGFILAAAFVNTSLGFYQESKAEATLQHLKTYIKSRTRVFRDGEETEIDSSELVPGDIIHLSQGDKAPADSRVVYVNDLMVDQSILTGESLPVAKKTAAVSFKAVLADQQSMIFAGTTVVQGFTNAVVCTIGKFTELGKIATLVAGHVKSEKTPLQRAVSDFGLKVGIGLVIITGTLFAFGLFFGQPLYQMFLTSIAMTVSAIPEGLPVAITVILAIGVQRLARRNGIVRKLMAAETLGSTSVILTDKTGTLTEAKMEFSKILIFNQNSPQKWGCKDTKELVLKLGILNSDVVIENPKDDPNNWRIIGRPLDVAIVKVAAIQGIHPAATKREIQILDYLPFSSVNKFSAATLEYKGNFFVAVLGAPEVLLKFSNYHFDEQRRISEKVNEMAYGGERIVAAAIKEFRNLDHVALRDKKTFSDFVFLGTISFRDPLRAGVKVAIKKMSDTGVRTVIVTGDHRGTAESVAKDLGFIIKRESVIDGVELDALKDEELKKKLPDLRIVSRVSPEGKVKIVSAFQSEGEIVAMTGDGVNDAPSLKQADIGVAMGAGTDVAQDVSDLVLLDNNYETIVAAIEEGRRILKNIKKAIVYLLSDALDSVILIGGSLLIGLGLPLNALQILWVNFFADSFPAIALAFEDKVDYLAEKPERFKKSIFDRDMKFLILTSGFSGATIILLLYTLLMAWGFDAQVVRTFVFASYGTYTLFLVFALKSLRKSIFSYNPLSNIYLVLSVFIGLALMTTAIYISFFQKLFGTVPLGGGWLILVLGVGALNIAIIEIAKWLLRRRKN